MKKFFINKINKLIILTLFLLLGFGHLAHASNLKIEASKNSFDMEEEFYVDFSLDTEGLSVNGVEGSIKFNNENLSLVRIEEGKSVVSLWVEKPEITAENTIKFSGIIPNGFDGVIDPFNGSYKKPGLLFRAIFKGLKESSSAISAFPINTTLNDGMGTLVQTTSFDLSINITNNTNSHIIKNTSDTPPELDFQIIQNSDLYAGKYVLIFQAKDKEAGIASVKIKEGGRKWVEIESPYLLKDQSRHNSISILTTNYGGISIIKNIDGIPYKIFNKFNLLLLLGVIGLFILLRKIYKIKHDK